MKKGINAEYDDNRNKLFETRFKIELLKKDPSKKQELDVCLQEAQEYLNNLKRIEVEYAKERTR